MGKAHLGRVEEETLALHSFIAISLELFAQSCSVQIFLPLARRRKVPAHLPHPDFVGSALSREFPCTFGPEFLVAITKSSGPEDLGSGIAYSALPIFLLWGKPFNSAFQSESPKH